MAPVHVKNYHLTFVFDCDWATKYSAWETEQILFEIISKCPDIICPRRSEVSSVGDGDFWVENFMTRDSDAAWSQVVDAVRHYDSGRLMATLEK